MSNKAHVPTESLPKIQNVVATAELDLPNPQKLKEGSENTKIDLKKIAQKCQNVTYNQKRFPAVIMRKQQPIKGTGLIFGSGKLIVIGTKSEIDAQQIAKHIAKDINRALNNKSNLNNKDIIKSFEVRNMVASGSLPFKVNLTDFADKNSLAKKDNTFPGCIYRIKEKFTALIFTSGKIVFTGAKKIEQIDDAFKNLKQLLQQYQSKQDTYEDLNAK